MSLSVIIRVITIPIASPVGLSLITVYAGLKISRKDETLGTPPLRRRKESRSGLSRIEETQRASFIGH